MSKERFVLNERGLPAGPKHLKGVFVTGVFKPYEHDYVIQVQTLQQNPDEPGEGTRGFAEIPVLSVGKIGLQYFFAGDLRFINYPGATCVLPERPKLFLRSEASPAGEEEGSRLALHFNGFVVSVRSSVRPRSTVCKNSLRGRTTRRADGSNILNKSPNKCEPSRKPINEKNREKGSRPIDDGRSCADLRRCSADAFAMVRPW